MLQNSFFNLELNELTATINLELNPDQSPLIPSNAPRWIEKPLFVKASGKQTQITWVMDPVSREAAHSPAVP